MSPAPVCTDEYRLVSCGARFWLKMSISGDGRWELGQDGSDSLAIRVTMGRLTGRMRASDPTRGANEAAVFSRGGGGLP